MALFCDAVFEGGGVKGIGFAGAIAALEEAGYRFQNVVGTSAGAIAAALVAVGYTGKEIQKELMEVDYTRFQDPHLLSHLGILGTFLGFLRHFGLFKTTYFYQWFSSLLERKGKYQFQDIRTGFEDPKYRYRFQAVASDLTEKAVVVLPGDLVLFGIDPDTFGIADAVQMSMSIPFYFDPVKVRDFSGTQHFLVDGGLLSNYPIWLLDDGTSSPLWPTFGLKLSEDRECPPWEEKGIDNILEYGGAVVSTLLEAHDNYHISRTKGDMARSILIPTTVSIQGKKKKIHTTHFSITPEESAALYHNGYQATNRFLSRWDFHSWVKRYRASIPT